MKSIPAFHPTLFYLKHFFNDELKIMSYERQAIIPEI